ncbi:MAG: DEAD/DEAH box helicase [Clostridiales Family XIII bacterium]|jgi:superfamily II DNA or RNA helicase|nr:DEAD/DEAH box helicase [Clostridiales Family XIII bacterium]
MTIMIGKLRELAEPTAITQGMACYLNGRIEIAYEDDDGGRYFGCVREDDGAIYDFRLTYTEDREDLDKERTDCTCRASQKNPGLCEHLVGALMQVQGGSFLGLAKPGGKKTAPKRAGRIATPPKAAPPLSPPVLSDRDSIDLIRMFASEIFEKTAGSQDWEPLRLEPTFVCDAGEGAYLTFRVGTDRLYNVRNLGEFGRNILNKTTMTFGKSDFRLGADRFDESSAALAKLIVDYANAGDYYYRSTKEKKSIDMTGGAIDAFFEAYRDDEILCLKELHGRRRSDDKSTLRIVRSDCKARVSLTAKNKGICLRIADDILILRGLRYAYVLRENELYICSEDYANDCCDFLRILRGHGSVGLFFTKEDASALHGMVLNRLERYLDIVADEDATHVRPAELVTKVWLDITTDGAIRARMEFSYGRDSFPAFGKKFIGRDFDLERELLAERVLKKYMDLPSEEPGERLLTDDDRIYELLTEGLDEIHRCAEVYTSDDFEKFKIRPVFNMGVGVKVDGRLLTMNIDLGGLDIEELADVIAHYRRAKKYKRLKDGSFFPLEGNESLGTLSELSDALDLSEEQIASGRIEMDVNRAMYVDALMKQNEELRYERDESFRSVIRRLRDVDDADFEAPPALRTTLRNYQQTGYRWLRTLENLGFGGILADDMGLGKTVEVLALLESRRSEAGSGLSIVVCPASVVLNWESEAKRFTPGLRVCALTGMKAGRIRAIGSFSEVDLVITSYGQLRGDIAEYRDITFDFAILDEAQFIKNQTTQNAKAVKKINARAKFALTGTPIENNLAELWSIFDFVMPGYLYGYRRFREKYETLIVKKDDQKATDRLRALARPFILRRLKREVLKELPEKTESVLSAPLEGEQRKVYMAMYARTKKELAAELERVSAGQQRIMILAALTRLRQICCDPSLLYENYRGGSAKLDACMELTESCIDSGHRILLFSQFTSMLHIIERELLKRNVGYYYLDGATPKHERAESVRSFNEGDIPIFLISLKAGGTGLNLTGADIVIHYDPWWNLSVQNQATDRTHRIGQTQKVQVYKLILSETIEERIMDLQKRKAQLADKVITAGGNAFDGLSGDELIALFEER